LSCTSFRKIRFHLFRAGENAGFAKASIHPIVTLRAADGINVPITLSIGGQTVGLIAKLDTGAANCNFERKYAEILGLEIESGPLQRFRTVAGSFAAYRHEVTMQTFGIEFSAAVFFAQDAAFSRNLLGRSGWLDRLRIGIIDYDRTLFLGPY